MLLFKDWEEKQEEKDTFSKHVVSIYYSENAVPLIVQSNMDIISAVSIYLVFGINISGRKEAREKTGAYC